MSIKQLWSDLVIPSPILDYSIDYPSAKHGSPQEGVGWVVQGWVLLRPRVYPKNTACRPYLSVKLNEYLIRYIPLDRARPDVIDERLVTRSLAVKQAQRHCGFRLVLPLSGHKLSLKLHLREQSYELTKLELPVQTPNSNVAKLKVLKGADDWLFLDNDTNFSVDQHSGLLGLSDSSLKRWQKYLDDWQTEVGALGAKALFLIAPTKESVLAQYHPYKKAQKALFDPVFQKMPAAMYLHPVEELRAVGGATFYKTDTHWTHQGAQITTCLVAQRLGLDSDKVNAVFAKDKYITKAHTGDLGNKLTPPCAQPADFLIGFSYRPWVIYDNGLQNMGRMIVMEYEKALVDSTCLIFGSSSSYSLFSFICRLFKRIVFVHTAGNVDKALVEKIKPDYFIAQTNARFMIRPPSFNYDVLTIIKNKQKNTSVEQQENQRKNTIFDERKKALFQGLGLNEYMVL